MDLKRFKLKNSYLFLILGLITFLPFIFISFYIHPTADDFCYSVVAREEGSWGAVKSFYNNWSGRYFYTLLMSIHPIVNGNLLGYQLTPIILLSFFALALNHLVKTIFPSAKQLSQLAITGFVSFLTIIHMPIVSDAFYWLSGSLSYFLSICLSIIFISNFISLSQKQNVINLTLCAIISFLIIGLSETTTLLFIPITLILVSKKIIEKRIMFHLIFLIIWIGLSFLLLYLAPGNEIRSQANDNLIKK